MKIPEYLNKKAVLEWLNHEIKDDNWAQFSAERALRDVRNFVESGAFDADESEGTWKATAEVLVRENAQMNSGIQRLRAALEFIEEEMSDDTSERAQRINKIIRKALEGIKP